MATPTKTEILEKATELYFRDNPFIQTNPEYSELLESGYIFSSQSELMRSPFKQYEVLPDKPTKESLSIYDFQFDYDLMQQSNLLISGCNNSGKTRLSALICNLLKNLGWQIIVFDNSGVWKQISDLPFFIEVDGYSNFPLVHSACIYDISDLTVDTQKTVVDSVLKEVWETRTIYETLNLLVVLEETEIYCKNLRGKTAQNILRIMHAGRNKKLEPSA